MLSCILLKHGSLTKVCRFDGITVLFILQIKLTHLQLVDKTTGGLGGLE